MEGEPPILLAPLTVRLYGSGEVRSNGHIAMLVWRKAPDLGEGWWPSIGIQQRTRTGEQHDMMVHLGPPPSIKEGRNAKACTYYARQECEELTRLISQQRDPDAVLREKVATMRKGSAEV